MSDPLALAAGFEPATRERWRAAVDKALAGAPFERLRTTLYDALIIEPVYAGADTPSGAVLGRAGAWDVRQIVSRAAPAAANTEALADLEGGATSIEFAVDRGDGRGVALNSAEDVAAALDGVMIDLAPIALDAGANTTPALLLAAHATKRGQKAAPLAFNLDPFAALLGDGAPPALDLKVARELAADFPNAATLRADIRAVHEAGGSERQELATLLAIGAAYLRAGENAGWSPGETARALLFTLAAGPDLIVEIAKLRAARLVWARLLSACGVEAPMRLQSVTGARMLTKRDPWVNLLRVTAAGFAGGVGGADIVTTAPLTAALGQPTPFARRLARNTQILLQEESHLARVADPAAGSWGVEKLTDELARGAWALFQDIETRGGIVAAFDWLSAEIGKVRDARIANARKRKDEITGVSAFPLLDERAVAFDPWPQAETPRKGLPRVRLAAPFEELRDRAERAGARKLFLATLGAPAQFAARENFAKNLFEAGGIPAVGGETGYNPQTLGDAFKASGAVAACLCGADAVYEASAEAAARALKQAGCAYVVLAGKPGAHEAALRAAGVDAFAYAGVDVATFLDGAHAAMGIAP